MELDSVCNRPAFVTVVHFRDGAYHKDEPLEVDCEAVKQVVWTDTKYFYFHEKTRVGHSAGGAASKN